MRTPRLLLGALSLLAATAPSAEAARHHRHLRRVLPVGYAPPPPEAVAPGLGAVPLAGLLTVPLGGVLNAPFSAAFGGAGTPVAPEAARFMGYPYNVPGYRYQGGDACLLRVGGPFGPGPSAGPCPFGLDRAF